MMRCDACQFWTPPESGEWEPIRQSFGHCNRTPHSEDMTKWDEEDDECRRVIVAEYADRTAAAVDGSGYYAGLITKPEHFCAMFRAKEGTPE